MSRRALAAAIALSILSRTVLAQPSRAEPDETDTARTFVLTQAEDRCLRALQSLGRVPVHPWTVRAFGPQELSEIAGADKGGICIRDSRAHRRGAVSVSALPVDARVLLNSSYPYGYNDGPLWAGRGLTASLQGGIGLRSGPITLILDPVAFAAQNSDFPLAPNGEQGPFVFADPFEPQRIDRPQRFGNGGYHRVDAGTSTLRLDAFGATLGASTANAVWGPAQTHPILLGTNAPGFPHVFAGTSRPANLWLARTSVRMIWGQLWQSDYTDMELEERRRFASGLVLTFTPRGVPGLEIGGARFFHLLWPENGPDAEDFLRPLSGILKASRIGPSGDPQGNEPDNQLASAFFRWVFPASGFEVYGEFGREDHNVTLRDLAKQPDHIGAYLLGFQRSWIRRTASGERLYALRGEVLNSRISSLQFVRQQSRFYVHTPVRQGHTHLGQVLGSEGAFGGGASIISLDRYDAAGGRRSITWSRLMRAEQLDAFGVPKPTAADVFHAIGIDGELRRGTRLSLTYELTAVYELNRDFARDAFNLRTSSGIRYSW